jgi:hypothetical protein
MAKELEIIHVEKLQGNKHTWTHGAVRAAQPNGIGAAQLRAGGIWGRWRRGRGTAQRDMLGRCAWREMFCWCMRRRDWQGW